MTPFYSDATTTLYCGDARDIVPTLGSGWADAIVADPPYGETSLPWDRWVDDWPSLVRPVLKPSGSMWCFGSMRMFLAHVAEFAGWRFAQDLVWEKHNGSSFHADRFKRIHEAVLQWYPVGVPWADVYKLPVTTPDATKRTTRRKLRPTHTGHIERGHHVSEDGGPRLMRSVLEVRSCHGDADHPTQKPLGILRPLLQYSVPPGGVVFDPFSGAGSTLVAAKEMGRRAVGIEADEAHCAATVRRLSQGVLALGGAA